MEDVFDYISNLPTEEDRNHVFSSVLNQLLQVHERSKVDIGTLVDYIETQNLGEIMSQDNWKEAKKVTKSTSEVIKMKVLATRNGWTEEQIEDFLDAATPSENMALRVNRLLRKGMDYNDFMTQANRKLFDRFTNPTKAVGRNEVRLSTRDIDSIINDKKEGRTCSPVNPTELTAHGLTIGKGNLICRRADDIDSGSNEPGFEVQNSPAYQPEHMFFPLRVPQGSEGSAKRRCILPEAGR